MRDMVLKTRVLLFREKMRMTGGRHRVVVVGGGFGGVNVTRALARADVDVTVVDRTNHHLFQPLLYQVAAGILSEGLIAPALRNVIRKQANARTLLADVQDLDVPGRRGLSWPASWPSLRTRSCRGTTAQRSRPRPRSCWSRPPRRC